MNPLEIYAQCFEEGDCLIWEGPYTSNGYPVVRDSELRRRVLVRRPLWEELTGKPIPYGWNATMRCKNPCCVSFGHMRLRTYSQIVQQAADEGKLSSPSRRASIAKAMQSRSSKVKTQETAQEIRNHPEPIRATAVKYGVSPSVVSRIRRNEAWRPGIVGNSVFNLK